MVSHIKSGIIIFASILSQIKEKGVHSMGWVVLGLLAMIVIVIILFVKVVTSDQSGNLEESVWYTELHSGEFDDD